MLNRTLPEWITFLLQAEVADTLVLHRLDVEALRTVLEAQTVVPNEITCADCKGKMELSDVVCVDCIVNDCEVEYRG